MQVLDIKENDRILIIAPHPDDECIGPGGVLLKYKDKCTVVVMTDGAIGQGLRSAESEKEIRCIEFKNEMEYLGITDYIFLNIPDGSLINFNNCLDELELNAYDYIFVTGNCDGHMDHTGAYEAVKKALNLSRPKKRPRVFLYEVHKQLAFPTTWLDITKDIEEKKKLISFHKSQLLAVPYDEMAALNARYRALQNRMSDRFIEVYQEIDIQSESENAELREMELRLHKHVQFYQILTKWLSEKIAGNSISEVLWDKGIRRVAIYGFAEMGKLLYQELSESLVKVEYVLDKDTSKEFGAGIKVYYPSRQLEKPDAVIVTAEFYFKEISDELKSLGYKNIYSISEVIGWTK